MAKYLLTESDHRILQLMVRWWRANKNIRPKPRQSEPKNLGGGTPVVWYKLSSVSANPMTGKLQTFDGTDWSDVSGAADTDIYVYPNFAGDLTHYAVDNIIPAVSIGGKWVSLYSQPTEFNKYTA